MVTEPAQEDAGPTRPALKVVEPEIDPNDIWVGDKLDRRAIAERLTTIIQDQDAPFVISLDGRWGTGKTFLLKRWKAQLANDEFEAIYFNAWEDDFCDDPLLAIIGQLAEHFQEGKLKAMAARIGEVALPILTGRLLGASLKREDLSRQDLLADYRTQLKTKREIRERLTDLAADVRKESDQPLVFIIDELDRCRPTFAIELLERVKHIFDVPNIVFVFGINRSELVKSLESVYGQIESGVYLRRFFDMEFILPAADPVKFCAHLMTAYGLDSFFDEMSARSNSSIHSSDFRSLSNTLPVVLGRMGLSLRDMDYCVRLVALTAKGLQERHAVFPAILAVLVATKISNPELYHRFVSGLATSAEIIDSIDERHRAIGGSETDPDLPNMEWVEAGIYFAGDRGAAWEQLALMSDGQDLTRPEVLAKTTRDVVADEQSGNKKLERLMRGMKWFSQQGVSYEISVPYVAELIDLYGESLRR